MFDMEQMYMMGGKKRPMYQEGGAPQGQDMAAQIIQAFQSLDPQTQAMVMEQLMGMMQQQAPEQPMMKKGGMFRKLC